MTDSERKRERDRESDIESVDERGESIDAESDADAGSESEPVSCSERVSVNQQMVFSDESESGLEVGEPAETSLGQFGVDLDYRDRESRLDRPSASSFGVDDRSEVVSDGDSSGEEVPLFRCDDEQMALDGSTIGFRWLFD